MKMFRGLVLGGPSDGAIMEFDAPYRRVAIVRDREPIIYPAANLSALTSHQELETLEGIDVKPLYTQEDAEAAIAALRPVDFGKSISPFEGLQAQFFCAGQPREHRHRIVCRQRIRDNHRDHGRSHR